MRLNWLLRHRLSYRLSYRLLRLWLSLYLGLGRRWLYLGLLSLLLAGGQNLGRRLGDFGF